jgi:hypothetical protein
VMIMVRALDQYYILQLMVLLVVEDKKSRLINQENPRTYLLYFFF